MWRAVRVGVKKLSKKHRRGNEMKRGLILFTAVLFVLPVCLYAQSFAVDKGSIMAGGTAGYMMQSGDLYENFDGDGQTTISINPTLGYFVMPNLAVGIDFLYENWSQGDDKSNTLGIGPGVAYFLGGSGSDMYPFIAAGYTFGSYSSEGANYKSEGSASVIPISVGVVKMVAKNVGVTAQVSYLMESMKPKDADEATKGTTILIGIGVDTFIF
jgi:outer membrane protein